jgi:hypothetical protein
MLKKREIGGEESCISLICICNADFKILKPPFYLSSLTISDFFVLSKLERHPLRTHNPYADAAK